MIIILLNNMSTKREVNRIKIQSLFGQNFSIKEIAKIVGVDYKTAKKWSKEKDLSSSL